MPDGIAPFMSPDMDDQLNDETELVAKAVFAEQHHCLANEVDALIDGDPTLQADFDTVMDFVARDALTDDCNLAVVDCVFIHLSDLGLVNAVPVKIVPGVGIATYSPRQLELAQSKRK